MRLGAQENQIRHHDQHSPEIKNERCFSVPNVDYFFINLPDTIKISQPVGAGRPADQTRTALAQEIETKETKYEGFKATVFDLSIIVWRISQVSLVLPIFVLYLLIKYGWRNAKNDSLLLIALFSIALSVVIIKPIPYSKLFFDNANDFPMIIDIDESRKIKIEPKSHLHVFINKNKKVDIAIYRPPDNELIEKYQISHTKDIAEKGILIYNILGKNSYQYLLSTYRF